jgi:cell shape-determining protein MreC
MATSHKYAFCQFKEVVLKIMDKMESNLNERIFELEKKLQEYGAEKEQLELTLRRRIRELYNRIKELESDNKKLKSALRDQTKFYEIHMPA